MNNFLTRIFLIIVLSLSAFGALAKEELQITENWVLSTQSGEQISWESLKGKPTILHFWATWCPYCKKLQPGLEKVQQKYQSQGLQLIGISFREDPGTYPQTVLEKRGHQFTTLVEGEAVAKLFGAKGTPTTFFIHADGSILGSTRTSNPNDPGLDKAAKILVDAYEG